MRLPASLALLPLLMLSFHGCGTSPQLRSGETWRTPSLAQHLGPRTLFLIKQGEKRGFVTRTGEIAIPPQFDQALDFREGRAAVCVGKCDTVKHEKGEYGSKSEYLFEGKWGFVDESGKYVVNPQFDGATGFNEGYASVCLGPGCSGYSLDTENNLDQKWGFIDQSGKLVVPHLYSNVREFSEGLAAVCVSGCGSGGSARWGYVDPTGALVISPQFDAAESFWDGVATVMVGKDKDKRIGYIDKAGKYLINPM